MFVEQFEQLDDTARRDLYAFEIVEPDSLAGKTQVEHDFTMMQALEALFAHGLLTGWAGDRLHCGMGEAAVCSAELYRIGISLYTDA